MKEPAPSERSLTPREIVRELDRYIIGQTGAKKAVAIAMRNRWRRRRVAPELKDEITPKNIIMIGPTGVGKTEIARRLAALADAPFVKVEATKFTEVGYVGRDVDGMVRDLVEVSVGQVRKEEMARVRERARAMAEDRLVEMLAPAAVREPAEPGAEGEPRPDPRGQVRSLLKEGRLAGRTVELEVDQARMPMMEIFSSSGIEEMGINMKEMFGNLFPGKRKRRRVSVAEALELLTEEEAQKLIDGDKVTENGVRRAEESGIIFLDEIDKIAGQGSRQGPDVSRQGVQRDILPIVEGTTVTTKHGPVRTDHMLFIAAGAFHMTRPSDLIPELQGRFPIRVELDDLTETDFVRILREPQNSLVRQYSAMVATEGVRLEFEDEAVTEIARIASELNRRLENIGARRLQTVMEKMLEEVSFESPDMGAGSIRVSKEYVRERLKPVLGDDDLTRYIL